MRGSSIALALVLAGLVTMPCLGQGGKSTGVAQPVAGVKGDDANVEQLRGQIQALQAKLQDMETSAPSSRVTQIGGTRPRGREPELVVRIYDLSDLFAMAPPYEAKFTGDLKEEDKPVFPKPAIDRAGGPGGMGGMGGGMGGMGGGFFSVKEKDKQPATVVPDASKDVLFQNSNVRLGAGRSSIDDLIKAITTTINPGVWEEVGGPASISSLGNSLIVSADEQTHQQIDTLLDLFRKRWGTLRTVSVRAYWFWLTDAQIAALVPEAEAAKARSGEMPAFGLANPQAWQKHLEQLAQDKAPQRPGYRAVLTCYNGQTVYAIAGGQSLAVTQIEPVLFKGDQGTPEGRVAYRPGVSVIHEGAAIQVTPIASISGKFVVIDVHSRVVEVVPPAKAAEKEAKPQGVGGMGGIVEMNAPAPAEVVAALDRPKLAVQRFSTTLRAPVEQPMLVGGMTFEGESGPRDQNLYLFLKVSVQELRDDAASKPTTESKGQPALPAAERPAKKVEVGEASPGKPGATPRRKPK
jgi:hypothetical protein